MSDPAPDPCGTTTYYPVEPYVGIGDLCGPCKGLEIREAVEAVEADPDADPPIEAVEAITAGADNALFLRNALFASRRVFIATGGKFPGCITTTWRPCARMACCGRGGWTSVGAYSATYAALSIIGWVSPCGCGDRCNCGTWDGIALPFGPIRSVESVTIDGDEFTDFEVDGRYLRRTDGLLWPTCNIVNGAVSGVGVMEVVFSHGIDIPPEAKPLIADYACELSKKCKPNSDCSLPNGYKVARANGVDYIVIDPMDYRLKLLTGFVPLDDWIMAIMGGHARTRPRLAGRRRLGRVMP